jgi:hypothetical protein
MKGALLLVTTALLAAAVAATVDEGLNGAPDRKPVMSRVFRPIYVKKGDPRAGKGSFEVKDLPTSTSAPKSIVVDKNTSGVTGRRKFGGLNADNACTKMGGRCQQTSTCGAVVTKLLCPGPAQITCCTYNSKACENIGGTCRDASTCVGTSSIGLCPGAKNIQCCTPIKSADGAAVPATPVTNTNCLYNFNGQQFAAKASTVSNDYKTTGVKFSDLKRQFGTSALKYANSLSFVISVLDSLGWGCIFATDKRMPAIIANMRIRSTIRSDKPVVGDIAVSLDDLAIVNDVCDGGSKASLVLMGASGPMTTGCIPLAQIQSMTRKSGTFLGFFTPQ